jgi:hypothetical protein
MISSSPTGMHIQFRTLMFLSRPEEQLQEQISFKESMTSLPAMIRTLRSSLGPHPESDLATDLYSRSIPIANMDESDHQISFNHLNKFTISLSAAIGVLDSPLRSHLERDLTTDLYSGSTSIAIKDESNCQTSFR